MNAKYEFNCLNITGPQQRDLIKMNLGPTLAKAGYTHDKFQLMILDDFANGLLGDWEKAILGDTEATKYVSGMAYHWYGNNKMSGYPDKLLEEVHKKYPNLFVLNTEACHLEGAGNGRWDFGEHYAYDIIRVMLSFNLFEKLLYLFISAL